MGDRFTKKNGLILTLLIVTIITGIMIFVELVENKKALEENLYSYIPVEVSSVLQINDSNSLQKLIPSQERLMPIVTALSSNVLFPVLFVEHQNNSYFMAKIAGEQENIIEEKLQNYLFPYYRVKKIKYKEIELSFYTTSQNDFFVYMLYNGFMVGGNNINLFQKMIDADITSNETMFNSPMSKEMLIYMKKHYPANIILNNPDCFSVFNIDFRDGKIEMEGMNTDASFDNCVSELNRALLKFDYSIFPDSVDSYQIEYCNSMITDSLHYLFELSSYVFRIPDQKECLYALKHKGDKFIVYNILNDLEEKYFGTRFDTNDFYQGYRIYTLSEALSKKVFSSESQIYLVFYRDYMIFSTDKNTVKEYLRKNGRYKPNDSKELNVANLTSIYYSRNIDRWFPFFLSAENFITHQNKEAHIISFFENEELKRRVLINN